MECKSSKKPLRILLYATDIGCILNQNPFCSRTETLKRVWYRIKGDDVPEAFRPSPDLVHAIQRTEKGIEIRRRKYTIQDYDKFSSLVSELKTYLETEGFSELIDGAEGFVRCEMGRNSEAMATAMAQAKPSIGRCESIQTRYWKRAWSSLAGDVEILISGRIDCCDQMGRVVEIKTRLARRPSIPTYEEIQLQTYLFLTDAPAGYIVELHDKDKLSVGPLMTFKSQWWNDEVIPALNAFADDLTASLMADTLVILDDISFCRSRR